MNVRRYVSFAVLTALTVLVMVIDESSENEAVAEEAVSEPSSWHTAEGLRVLEVEHGPHNATLPMVVFLHGRGDHAQPGVLAALEGVQARFMFPQAPLPFDSGYQWFTHGPGGDPALLAKDVELAREPLARAISELAQERPTAGKPIVIGFSQGAVMAFGLAFSHPKSFALVVPVAGELPLPLYAGLPLAKTCYPPVRALHGTADDIVPITPTKTMVDQLKSRGMDITLQAFEGAQHELSPAMQTVLHELIRDAVTQAATQHTTAHHATKKPTPSAH